MQTCVLREIQFLFLSVLYYPLDHINFQTVTIGFSSYFHFRAVFRAIQFGIEVGLAAQLIERLAFQGSQAALRIILPSAPAVIAAAEEKPRLKPHAIRFLVGGF